jgi:hypothetical protein
MSYPLCDVVMSAHVRFVSVSVGVVGGMRRKGTTNMIHKFSILFLSSSTALLDYAFRSDDLELWVGQALHRGDTVVNGMEFLR